MKRAACLIVASTIACGVVDESKTDEVSTPPGTLPIATSTPEPLPPPLAEAGFIDVPPRSADLQYERMFYVFQPADTDAVNKPLAILFNGGPGVATTGSGLLALGTGRFAIDSDGATDEPFPNAASWTRFANLLYIDERRAGFSYGIVRDAVTRAELQPRATESPCDFEPEDDAADFVHVVLRFLRDHPSLRRARVVLVGESYGGFRAQLMLDALLNRDGSMLRLHPDIAAELREHYRAVFDETDGNVDEQRAATQFGWQVLIQPLVFDEQMSLRTRSVPSAVPGSSPYHRGQTGEWYESLMRRSTLVLADRRFAKRLMGVDWTQIPGMAGDDRGWAFRRPPTDSGQIEADATVNASMSAVLGTVRHGDAYYLGNIGCFMNFMSATRFAQNLRHVHTFLTNASWDGVVDSAQIPRLLERHAEVDVDAAPRAGIARPGWFRVTFPEPPATIEVRFPTYAKSGHMVAASEPAALAEDVEAFLLDTSN
jgi:hypothetical protein